MLVSMRGKLSAFIGGSTLRKGGPRVIECDMALAGKDINTYTCPPPKARRRAPTSAALQ